MFETENNKKALIFLWLVSIVTGMVLIGIGIHFYFQCYKDKCFNKSIISV